MISTRWRRPSGVRILAFSPSKDTQKTVILGKTPHEFPTPQNPNESLKLGEIPCSAVKSQVLSGLEFTLFSKISSPRRTVQLFWSVMHFSFRKKSPTPKFFVSLARNHATFRKFGVDPSIDQRCLREACNLMLVDQHQSAEPAEPVTWESNESWCRWWPVFGWFFKGVFVL